MPIMNGQIASKKILDKMKELQEPDDSCHIIALTSYSNMEKECLEIGMKRVYNKPITADAIFEVV